MLIVYALTFGPWLCVLLAGILDIAGCNPDKEPRQ